MFNKFAIYIGVSGMVFLILHVLLQCLDINCSPVFIIYIETPHQLLLPRAAGFIQFLDSGILGCSGVAVVLVFFQL